MNNLIPPQKSPDPSNHYIHLLSPTCGFTIVAEGDNRLLWLTIAGKLEFHQCNTSEDLLTLLEQTDLQNRIEAEWTKSADPDESFEAFWSQTLSAVAIECLWLSAKLIQENPAVTPRLKQQLLWAFNDDGSLDPEIFLTILIYENIWLSNLHLMQLVNELTQTHANQK